MATHADRDQVRFVLKTGNLTAGICTNVKMILICCTHLALSYSNTPEWLTPLLYQDLIPAKKYLCSPVNQKDVRE
jgi:hypothetical protein